MQPHTIPIADSQVFTVARRFLYSQKRKFMVKLENLDEFDSIPSKKYFIASTFSWFDNHREGNLLFLREVLKCVFLSGKPNLCSTFLCKTTN